MRNTRNTLGFLCIVSRCSRDFHFFQSFCSKMLFVALFCILFGYSSAQTSRQPEQVHLSMTNNVTEMVVTWVTMDLTTDSIVEYNKRGGPLVMKVSGTYEKFVDGAAAHRTMYMHRATMTGLVPEQSYDYHVGGAGGWSPVFYFTVRPAGSNWSPQLALYGDMGNKNARSVAFLQEETLQGHFDAILHVGDFAYNMDTDESRVGDEFMRQIEPIAAYLPYMTCPGNHEYAYVNIGPVHFISFSSEFYFFFAEEGMERIPEQYAWLEKDLKEATAPENRTLRPWIITMAHRPMYCSNNDGDDCTKHESVICNGSIEEPYTNPCAPIHIITGSAGCSEQHDPFKNYYGPWTAYRSTDYGYTRMKVHNGSHIYMEQFSADKNAVIDKLWIIREKHGY